MALHSHFLLQSLRSQKLAAMPSVPGQRECKAAAAGDAGEAGSEAGDCHPGAGRLLVIFIHGWILPFRLLKLLVAPCVDQVDHYKRRRHAQDALASAAQHVGDAFAEIAWEGALLKGRQAVGDHVPYPRQVPKLAAHGDGGPGTEDRRVAQSREKPPTA